MSFVEFLKKYTTISNKFINDFYKIFDEKAFENDSLFIINHELLVKWLELKSKKKEFVKTLKNSYKINVDYIVKEINKKGSGGKKNKIYMLTTEAAKRYCLMTKSAKGDSVRRYFIEIEKSLYKYQKHIIKSLEDKIKKLENNQKPKIIPKKGIIYVFRALNGDITLHKIGRSIKIKKRMTNHNSSMSNDIELIMIYEADNIIELEKCVKLLMKSGQYRKYKEVYQVDIDIIKKVIKDCDSKLTEINDAISKQNQKKITKGGKTLITKNDRLFMVIP